VPTHVADGVGDYWAVVSTTYDAGTPTTLLVWLHGCGGDAEGDAWTVAPYGGQHFVAISVGGTDGGCWDMDSGPALVRAAVSSAAAHFTIDPHRVFVGGYSSGGDLAYRTAFESSAAFAGVLVTNTSPFRDTGRTAAQSLGAATSRFHVVHLLHTSDDVYPRAGVVAELAQVRDAGFPVVQLERPGHHYDDPTDPATGLGGTSGDIQQVLIPYLDGVGASWSSP
jgi:predicted esterase